MEKFIFKSYEDLVEDIRKNIGKVQGFEFDLVVGVPRSGMIPAYIISAYLNIDCTDVDSLVANKPLQRGITRNTKGSLNLPQEATQILLVDDSIYSGKSFEQAKNKIPAELATRVKTLAVYSSDLGKKMIDIYLEYLDGTKLFEWGIFHNNIISKTCIDVDGVLCRDPRPEENDDGEKYLNFIKNASPLFIPTGEAYALVSNRLEKYRAETEVWLKKHGVKYRRLVLLNLPTKEDRLKIDAGIEHKGKFFKNFDAVFFIESSYNQAISIAKVSGKPVYCVDKNKFISPDLAATLMNNPGGLIGGLLNRVKHKIKLFLGRI